MAGKTRGRKKLLTKSKLPKIKKLIEDNGHFNISNLATALKVSWLTLKKFIDEYPQVQKWLDEANDELIDMAENTIKTAIENGDMFTAKWLLALRSKRYREKPTEVDVKGEININIIDAVKDKGKLEE